MIAFIMLDNDFKVIKIKDGKTKFELYDHSLYFLKNKQGINLRAGYEFEFLDKQKISHASMQKLIEIKTGRIIFIIYSQYDEGYDLFNRYSLDKNILTVGSAIDDDLYIQDQQLHSHHFTIDFSENIIFDHYHSGIGYLNSSKVTNVKFNYGDVFRVSNLQVVFHNEFIMINSPKNIYRSLPLYQNNKTDQPLKVLEPYLIHRKYREVDLNRLMICKLDEPLPLQKVTRQPLVFMMGPAITMASASLMSGLVATYNGYLKGRMVYEMLPMILLPSVMLVSALVWNPAQRIHEKKREKRYLDKRLDEYLKYLEQLEEEIKGFIRSYKDTVYSNFYIFSKESENKISDLLYQKLPYQGDWMNLYLGNGLEDFEICLKKHFHLNKMDELHTYIEKLVEKYEKADDCPIILDLNDNKKIYFYGSNYQELFSNLLIQLCLYHAPDVLKIIFLIDETKLNEMHWIYDVPHSFLNEENIRLIVCNQIEALEVHRLMKRYNDQFEFLIISFKDSLASIFGDLDPYLWRFDSGTGVPADSDASICIHESIGTIQTKTRYKKFNTKLLKKVSFDTFFKQLLFAKTDHYKTDHFIKDPTFFDLYSVNHANELHIEQRWAVNLVRDHIRAVIGLAHDNEKILIDFHERGHGPHGLMAGMTGSGKSEMIITLVLSLAINYSPEELQFVLIDFKGGGASQVFSNDTYQLPHIAGVLSNLDLSEMERALVSLSNECKKRETLFRKLSSRIDQPVMNLSDYQKYWSNDFDLPKISALLIIVDEFAELKKEKPEFMKDLMTLARVGRSLGIHLLLATQKPAGVISDQIWSNARFKISLKVQDAQDSREMIQTDRAAFLKKPGEFFLYCDGLLTHGQSGYVNAIDNPDINSVTRIDHMMKKIEETKTVDLHSHTQLINTIKEILEVGKHYQNVENLWLPPLKTISIDNFLKLSHSTCWIPFGIIDDYYHQCRSFISIEKNTQSLLIYSLERSVKEGFIHTLIFMIISKLSKHDEIYIIDDLNINFGNLSKICMLIRIFSSDHEELIRNLFNHIFERSTDSNNECFLIITDTSAFINSDAKNHAMVLDLIENLEKYNVKIILFSSSPTLLPYRFHALISNRISLKNENLQELMTIFETRVNHIITKEYFGIVKKDHLVEFMYPKVRLEQLNDLCDTLIDRWGQIKPYQLKEMPQMLNYDCYRGEDVPLGMNIYTYEWCCVAKNDLMVVLTTYEEEAYGLYNLLVKKNIRCFWQEDKTFKTNDIVNGIIFYTLDQFQGSSNRNQLMRRPILYLGCGFHDQYVFITSYKKQLAENQGVFYSKGKNQVIQIVEE